MSDTIAFTVPAVPVAQPRQRVRVMRVGTKHMAQNYTPKRDPVNAYKAIVAHAAASAYGGPPIGGAVAIGCLFVMPRPKAMRWKTKPMPRAPHCGRPDIDNLYKSLVDALKGVLLVDDSQIYAAKIAKMIASGDEQPHCEVVITIRDTEEPEGKEAGASHSGSDDAAGSRDSTDGRDGGSASPTHGSESRLF